MAQLSWNVFRILADLCHGLSKCILIWAIYGNRSAEGVSLITQSLYLAVFCARYLPRQYWGSFHFQWHHLWNLSFMTFYIASSAFIVWLMMRVFARTRETEKAWKMGIISSIAALCLAPFVMLIFNGKDFWGFSQFCWVASEMLESVCVLPQLLLLRQTTVPTVIDSFYLVALGSYRALYIGNWIVRGVVERHFSRENKDGDFWISFIFGVIQTALYLDFAWVYWSRQRVKLRGGAVVDTDDLNHGWLIKRFVGRSRAGGFDEEDGPEVGGDGQPTGRNWGARGISVSADEDLPAASGERDHLADPTEFEDALSDDDDDAPAASAAAHSAGTHAAIGNGAEWGAESTKL